MKTKQPCFEDRIGPWLLSVSRPEIRGSRGIKKGYRTNHFSVSIRHEPLDFELFADSFDDSDYSRLAEELDHYLSPANSLLRFFSDPIPNAKAIIMDLADAMVESAEVPKTLHSKHE